MGLDLSVGRLSELNADDPESCGAVRGEYAKLSQALVQAGLAPHVEPEELPEQDRFSCQMFGYSGLHYLRRIAAHDALGLPLPPPGDGSKDPRTEDYYDRIIEGDTPSLRGRPGPLPFEHLMLHSDAEGFYAPQDFPHVVFADASIAVPGDMIGSVPRLLLECRALARLLEVPTDGDPEGDEFWDAADSQGEGEQKWQRYGVESYGCVRLVYACETAMRSGAAVVFC